MYAKVKTEPGLIRIANKPDTSKFGSGMKSNPKNRKEERVPMTVKTELLVITVFPSEKDLNDVTMLATSFKM